MIWEPATQPTIYFIGVSTTQSSIMKIFPNWAKELGLGDCAIVGIDFALHDRPEAYREAVEFIKTDPLSRGALVTTHKIDLLDASADLFDQLDDFARTQNEVSCLSKRNGRLIGHAKDPISARLALETIIPPLHWRRTRGEVLAIGAGGATTAITWNLMRAEHGDNRPRRLIVCDIDSQRLDGLRRFHEGLRSTIPVDYVVTGSAEQNDALQSALAPGSLVINATGLGKDRPGSPLTDAATFPDDGLVWELNYRGDLVFLTQADAQAERRRLSITDGWNYFLHGWTQVIAEVFDVAIPPAGPRFDRLSDLAGGSPRLRAAARR